jgi:hypothetical protein
MDVTSAKVVMRFLEVIEQDILPLTIAAMQKGNRRDAPGARLEIRSHCMPLCIYW